MKKEAVVACCLIAIGHCGKDLQEGSYNPGDVLVTRNFSQCHTSVRPYLVLQSPQTVSKAQEQLHASVMDISYVNFNIMLMK